ncbi:MAG: Gfo/Idh/MocA family oxidoreductase [Thermoguttaceae bacterium]
MNQQRPTLGVSRRKFLGTAAGVAAIAVVPRHVVARGQALPSAVELAPSETITYAVIGNGGRKDAGLRGTKSFKQVAVCDVYEHRLGGDPDNKTRFTDFRRLLERKDIDVVCIATHPSWHALITIAAAQAGKDVFCEKPFTKFIAEGRAAAEAVKRYGVMFQIGTFGRFDANREIHKIVKSGLLPDLKGVVARGGGSHRVGKTSLPEQPVPPGFHYDLWLGPAPYKPYNAGRALYPHRFYWDYEGGDLTNMGYHAFDPVQYTFAKDDTGPVEIEPFAAWPQHPDAVGEYDHVVLTYADGLKIVVGEGGKSGGVGSGRRISRNDLSAEDRAKLDAMPDPPRLVPFAEAVRTRQSPGGNAESSHRASTALNLANLAIRLGRRLHWDPAAERFVGDDEANRFVDIPMRAPWHL